MENASYLHSLEYRVIAYYVNQWGARERSSSSDCVAFNHSTIYIYSIPETAKINIKGNGDSPLNKENS